MRVLVCGGRNFNREDIVSLVLDSLDPRPTIIIHGSALGADLLANRWAQSRQIPTAAFPANWLKHGRAAGPIRNAQMLRDGRPDLVVAFPGGRGTADMVRRAEKARVPVYRAGYGDMVKGAPQ